MSLDPYAGKILEVLAASGRPGFEELSPPDARLWLVDTAKAFRGDGAPLPGVSTEDRVVEAVGRAIKVRFYRPGLASASPSPAPVLMFFHGGGWVIGDLDTHDAFCRILALASQCPVLAVDYRLAPEHPFPAAIEDSIAVFDWLIAESQALGIDVTRIGVSGDSAGATVAAALALVCRDTGRRLPCLQVLMYPATDLRGGRESRTLYGEGFLLTEKQIAWCVQHYIQDEAGKSDPRASPLLAESLQGLPRAIVAVSGCDPLRDEGLAFAERLRLSEVEVDLIYCPGLIHGFMLMTDLIPMADRAFRKVAGAVQAVLGRAYADYA